MIPPSRTLPLLLLAGLICPPVSATERSEVLLTQALFDLDEGRYADALARLETAVISDPSDLQSRYYRAVTLSRMGEFARALQALEPLAAESNALANYPHELGYLHYRLGDFTQAEAAFSEATARAPSAADSHYYLGLSRYKRQAYASAIGPFTRAAELDPKYAASASYLIGFCHYQQGELGKARTILTQAAADHPESVYAGAIADLLINLDTREATRPDHYLALTLGVTQDSNAGLFADSSTIDASGKRDHRAEFELRGGYLISSDEYRRKLLLAYELNHHSYSELDAYDLTNHSLGIDWQQNRSDGYLAAYYRYRSATLGGDAYQSGHLLGGAWGMGLGAQRFGILSLQFSDLSYDAASLSGRDPQGISVTFRHVWSQANEQSWYLQAGIASESTPDPDFKLQRLSASVGLDRPLGKGQLNATLGYQSDRYPDSTPTREEESAALDLAYRHPFDRHWSLSFSLNTTEHPSTWTDYDYSRNTATLAVHWVR